MRAWVVRRAGDVRMYDRIFRPRFPAHDVGDPIQGWREVVGTKAYTRRGERRTTISLMRGFFIRPLVDELLWVIPFDPSQPTLMSTAYSEFTALSGAQRGKKAHETRLLPQYEEDRYMARKEREKGRGRDRSEPGPEQVKDRRSRMAGWEARGGLRQELLRAGVALGDFPGVQGVGVRGSDREA